MRPCPPDALPIMGKIPGYKNAYINAGHNCWGILWAPVAGKTMAEIITTGKSDIDVSAFTVERFGVRKGGGKGGRGRKRGKEEVGEQW